MGRRVLVVGGRFASVCLTLTLAACTGTARVYGV